MASDPGERMKIVIGYAVWATLCAAAAGVALSLIHTWFFSYHATRPGFWRTLLEACRRQQREHAHHQQAALAEPLLEVGGRGWW